MSCSLTFTVEARNPEAARCRTVLTNHYAGWTVGTPQTEETQNRLIAARNKAIVVSVDYRLCARSS